MTNHKKGKNRKWVFSENDQHKLKSRGKNDNFKDLWDCIEKNIEIICLAGLLFL